MRNTTVIILLLAFLASCEKEINIDYHEVDPIVVIEGRVTNEGTVVQVRKTRSVNDSVHGTSLPGAGISIFDDGEEHRLAYDPDDGNYKAELKGTPGHTYRMDVEFEGRHYEATSTMPKPSSIISTDFYWFKILDERLLVDVMWAVDPEPEERNYYLYRVDRRSANPHISWRMQQRPYRWNVFDDRGTPPGRVYRDIHCMMEQTALDDKEDDWDQILYDGDIIMLQLLTIDQRAYEYFRSLTAGQNQGANPESNISGGCLGYFMAAGVTHADTVVFHRDEVVEYTEPEMSGFK